MAFDFLSILQSKCFKYFLKLTFGRSKAFIKLTTQNYTDYIFIIWVPIPMNVFVVFITFFLGYQLHSIAVSIAITNATTATAITIVIAIDIFIDIFIAIFTIIPDSAVYCTSFRSR